MIGSSVVPGLPNRWVMPSSLSSARKAERPVMRFFMLDRFLLPGSVLPRSVARGALQHDQTWRTDAMECAHACPALARARSRAMLPPTVKDHAEENRGTRSSHHARRHSGLDR